MIEFYNLLLCLCLCLFYVYVKELDASTPQLPSPRVNRDKKVSHYLRSLYVQCDPSTTYQHPDKRRYLKFKKNTNTEYVFLCMYNTPLICVTFKYRRLVSLFFNANAAFFKHFETKSYQLKDDVSQLFLIFNYLA